MSGRATKPPQPGTCVYDNPTDSEVRSGERTEDEICFNFLYAYPAPPAGMRGCGD